MLVRREGSGGIPLLEPAERRVIGGVRIGGFVLGDEDEMRQRIAGMTVVEEKETQRVMRPNVLGRNRQNALENLLRLGRIAVALTVQRGDRKVDAKIQSIRSGGRRARECFGRPIEVELAHESDPAVVEGHDVDGACTRPSALGTRTARGAGQRDNEHPAECEAHVSRSWHASAGHGSLHVTGTIAPDSSMVKQAVDRMQSQH